MTRTDRLTALAFGLAMAAGLAVSAHPARAAVAVGDSPKLEFQAADGSPISLDKFKGKIVVVDFWATWCGPCMAEAGHMVEINSKYAPQGLQFIGISLDQDKAKMLSVAKDKGFVWPQYFDGKFWQTKYAVEWGVQGIPATFIISPEGKVLWTGHPGGIDAPLAQAFKDHPPVLVDPKALADGKAAVEKAQAALKDGNAKAALAAMAKVPAAAKADKEFAAQAESVGKELAAAADKMLADVGPMVEAKQYAEAVGRLRELSAALEGTPAGAKAKKQLGELENKPEVKSAIAKAARGEKAQALFAAAQELKDAKNDEQAYPKFKGVAADYPDTDAGAKAADVVKEYEKDAAFVKRVTDSAASAKATSTLKVAQSYASAGRTDMARKKYQEVIDQYPGTSYADQAKKALAAMK